MRTALCLKFCSNKILMLCLFSGLLSVSGLIYGMEPGNKNKKSLAQVYVYHRRVFEMQISSK